MTVCGHQFHGGDAADWILSTSANCLVGSTTANQILQELFKRQITDASDKIVRKKQRPGGVKAQPNNGYYSEDVRKENENLIEKRDGYENFDKSQHLNGCPMKWLYNKKRLEKNKRYKVDRICYNKLAKEEFNRNKSKNVRDKTPAEVKIHKINLTEKYTTICEESYTSRKPLFGKKPENGDAVLEIHRKKLAAKLNWKLHDESPDVAPTQSSKLKSVLKHNYLPPRPMLGLKPFLSLLLAPNQMTNCCSLPELARNSAKKEKITTSLSVQFLDLPDFPPRNSQPRSTNSSRWGSKSSRLSKKLQLPSQITINLDGNGNGGFKPELKIRGSNPTIKKLNDKPKQAKSLSALFYELKEKSDFGNGCVEDMMKDLTVEGRFKIRRFLNITTENVDFQVGKIPRQERDKQKAASAHLVRGKNRLSGKP